MFIPLIIGVNYDILQHRLQYGIPTLQNGNWLLQNGIYANLENGIQHGIWHLQNGEFLSLNILQ